MGSQPSTMQYVGSVQQVGGPRQASAMAHGSLERRPSKGHQALAHGLHAFEDGSQSAPHELDVAVPANATPGTTLTVKLSNGQRVSLKVPPGSRPGQILKVRLPPGQAARSDEECMAQELGVDVATARQMKRENEQAQQQQQQAKQVLALTLALEIDSQPWHRALRGAAV